MIGQISIGMLSLSVSFNTQVVHLITSAIFRLLGRSMKEALQAADEEEDPTGANSTTAQMVLDPKSGKMVVPPEEKARLERIKKEKDAESDRERRERVDKLVKNLGESCLLLTG